MEPSEKSGGLPMEIDAWEKDASPGPAFANDSRAGTSGICRTRDPHPIELPSRLPYLPSGCCWPDADRVSAQSSSAQRRSAGTRGARPACTVRRGSTDACCRGRRSRCGCSSPTTSSRPSSTAASALAIQLSASRPRRRPATHARSALPADATRPGAVAWPVSGMTLGADASGDEAWREQ
jgi:hypothetical protein